VFRGDFYMTGDCAHKDEDGYFWFSSRADDVISSSGYLPLFPSRVVYRAVFRQCVNGDSQSRFIGQGQGEI